MENLKVVKHGYSAEFAVIRGEVKLVSISQFRMSDDINNFTEFILAVRLRYNELVGANKSH